MFDGYCGMGSAPSDRYYSKLPVWAGGNVFFNGAKPMTKEKDAECVESKEKVTLSLDEKDGKIYLITNLYDYMPNTAKKLISTDTLGMAFEPEMKYENPDGSPIIFNEDILGIKRGFAPLAGPFTEGASRIAIF